MAELNPPLGTTTPEIFLDNVKRADELVNGPAGTVNDRAGEPLDTWRQMMAKNDEIRQNLIPLSKQYMTLAAAQADIANIPKGAPRITAARMIARWLSRSLTTPGRCSLPGGKCPLRRRLMRCLECSVRMDWFPMFSFSGSIKMM
jgi:hypothetical protein